MNERVLDFIRNLLIIDMQLILLQLEKTYLFLPHEFRSSGNWRCEYALSKKFSQNTNQRICIGEDNGNCRRGTGIN